MSVETLNRQQDKINKVQQKFDDFKIIKGIEVDILNDGKLDYSDDLLSQLDFVIASIHTGFNQSRSQITTRIIEAMHNPYVNVIGHPQGRILGRRKAYEVDMDRVIEQASETGTFLEINASPFRLDLNDALVKQARECGVKIVINTDAHHIDELDDMKLGVEVARRGWLEKEDVINTFSYDELISYFRGD